MLHLFQRRLWVPRFERGASELLLRRELQLPRRLPLRTRLQLRAEGRLSAARQSLEPRSGNGVDTSAA